MKDAVGLVESAVGTGNVPESVRALGSLPEIDYADLFTLFTLSTRTDATPEPDGRAVGGTRLSPARHGGTTVRSGKIGTFA